MVSLIQNQKDYSGVTHVSVGIRSFPRISFIHVSRVLPPFLHLFLGLGNDMCSKVQNFISIRIENESDKEIEAQQMSFLAEIRYDEVLVMLDDLKKEAEETRRTRFP